MPPAKPQPATPRLVLLGGIVVIAGFAIPHLLAATATDTATASDGPSPIAVFLKLTLGLGVIAGASVVYARWFSHQGQPIKSNNLELLATMQIDVRTAVHLARMGDRRLLIGTDATGVKAVKELPGFLPKTESEVLGPWTMPVVATR